MNYGYDESTESYEASGALLEMRKQMDRDANRGLLLIVAVVLLMALLCGPAVYYISTVGTLPMDVPAPVGMGR